MVPYSLVPFEVELNRVNRVAVNIKRKEFIPHCLSHQEIVRLQMTKMSLFSEKYFQTCLVGSGTFFRSVQGPTVKTTSLVQSAIVHRREF